MDLAAVSDRDFIRWFVFLAILLVGVPIGTFLCISSRRFFQLLFGLMVFSLCDPDGFGVSFLSQAEYRAAIRGFDVYLADLCALTLAISLVFLGRKQRVQLRLPLLIPFALFLLVGFLSWCAATGSLVVPETRVLETITVTPPPYSVFDTSLYPWFEIWRIARGVLLFWVTANVLRQEDSIRTLVYSLLLAAAYLTLLALRERYLFGVYRVSANLLHPNDFAVYCAMLASIFLPLALQQKKLWISIVAGVLFLAMGGCIVLTVSRSALAIYGLVGLLTLLFVLPRHLNGRNLLYVGVGAILIVTGFVVAADTLESRFLKVASVTRSWNERDHFNEEGRLMAKDHPFGVGLGNFSAWSWEQYAQQVDADLEPGVPAHNIWYLTLGETGWLGVITLALIWLRFYQLSIFAWWRGLPDEANALLIGTVLATVSLHLQSLVHFSYRNGGCYHLAQLLVGLLVAIVLVQNERQKTLQER